MMIGFIPSNLDLSSNKHRDKLYFILTLIYYGRVSDKIKDSNSYIELYSVFLRDVIGGRYIDYLQMLIEDGIIETDNHYKIKEKSKGYRLCSSFRDVKIKQVMINDEKINRNYFKYKDKIKNKLPFNLKHIYNCLEKIEIDDEGAKKYIDENFYTIEQYNSLTCSINLIKSKVWFFVKDKTSGRLHNNVTNLSRDLRPYLRYNGEGLVEIDIANSQPLLLNILISRYFTDSQSIFNETIELPDISKFPDLIIYKELTESGKFYEFMQEKVGSNEERSVFKKRMFSKVFYGKEDNSEEREIFRKCFPTVSEIVSHYKNINYRDLAVELQRVEAQIMLENVVGSLAKENIFALTIHDSILTTKNNVDKVVKILESEFSKFGLKPTIKTK